MTWSLGESEALAVRAARGAGLPWGLAEEAGRALRWLEARGLPGAAALADALGRVEAGDAGRLRAFMSGAAPGAPLCPIRLGAALSDFGADAVGPGLGPVRQPLLLAPFLAGGRPRALAWPGAAIALRPEGPAATGSLLVPHAECRLLADPPALAGTTAARTRLPASAAPHVAALATLAARICAPATEASRAGAGAADAD